ncbi:MAG: aminotransferase class III-fold pyridoxal phosphate-dependent enzyme, partial [Deltaproteobacteria bacterium]
IMTLAKALGAGFPVGAMLATDDVASAFAFGDHASTFGGNALAMAVCRKTMETIKEEGLLKNCQSVGSYFLEKLFALKDKKSVIKAIRGKGLIIAVEFDVAVAPIVKRCYENGVLIGTAGEKVLRFVPPLIVSKNDIDNALSVIEKALE